jgi:hypothetical protein
VSIQRILAEAFASVVVSIDLSDDEEIDPDVATKILEPVSALLVSAPRQDQIEISRLITSAAEKEENPARRDAIRGLPDALGIEH